MVNAVVDSLIRIPASGIPPKALALIRRDLTFTNPEYVKRVKFDRWVGATPEEICLLAEGGDGALLVPRGAVEVVTDALARIGELIRFDDRRMGFDPVRMSLSIELRDYQREAVIVLVRHTQGCAVLPCGSGKTIIGVGIIAETGQPALILVHTKDLMDQWVSLVRTALEVEPGVICEGTFEPDRVTVAMVQSLAPLSGEELARLGRRFGQVLVDECVPGHTRVVLPSGVASVEGLFRAMQSGESRRCEVLSFNHTAGTAEFKPVSRIVRKAVRRRMVTLRVRVSRSVRILDVTEDHPVYVVGRGYVPAGELRPRDRVLASRAFFPCSQCDFASTSGSGMGGHTSCVHGQNPGLARMQASGAPCRYCGRFIGNCAALRVHEHRHEDESFDTRRRDSLSGRMRATNLARRDEVRKRMRDRNPMSLPGTREKVRTWHSRQAREWYVRLNGGNGQPPTKPEALLLARLPSNWVWQHILPTGMPRGSGYPPHYKLDLACPQIRLAVEVDGNSHKAERVKAADRRKQDLLAERGWTLLRFWNREVLDDPEAVVRRITEVADGLRCP
jgi:hypothetical protein